MSKSLFRAIRLKIPALRNIAPALEGSIELAMSAPETMAALPEEISFASEEAPVTEFRRVLFGYQTGNKKSNSSIVIPRGAMVDKKIA